MADKQYAGASGIVQFDPRSREANGKTVTDVVIRANGSQKLVQITVWPEYLLETPIKKGDFVAADGSFETRTYQAQDGSTRESLQLNPSSLVVVPCVPKAERSVVQAPAASSSAAPF